MSSTRASMVLFDVDGTLLLGASRLHMAAMREAFTQVFGVRPPLHSDERGVPWSGQVCLAGLIDREVFAAAAEAVELGAEALSRGYPQLLEVFTARYAKLLAEGGNPGTPIPGAHDTLTALADAGVRLGLLTGNAHQVAAAKLAAVGLARFFAFDAAAGFGAHARDRAGLVPAALTFAERTGVVDRKRIALVGDTTQDVAAAVAHGLHPVGIASGAADRATLLAAGAELVLDDLVDAAAPILALLGG